MLRKKRLWIRLCRAGVAALALLGLSLRAMQARDNLATKSHGLVPHRAVSLSASATETLPAPGARTRLAGVDEYTSKCLQETRDLRSVGSGDVFQDPPQYVSRGHRGKFCVVRYDGRVECLTTTTKNEWDLAP